jgi:MoaA/NifB/PqqE/SkfB family radical SAM enzyme
MPDDRYCPAPWNNISISNFGTIKPCPLFDTKLSVKPKFDVTTRNIELDNISDDIIYKESTVKPNESFVDWYDRQYEDVKTHNSVDHPGCRTCARAEKEGIKSRRQMQLNPNAGGDYINYIDISFGNVCNLKCLMCNSHNSTKWIKEEQHLKENGFYIDNIHGKREMHPKMLLQLIDYCNNIECASFTINVKGGEPFVTAEFLSFISKLSSQFKQKTKIKVFTNAAVVPTEYLDELSEFEQVTLSISLEAVDDGLYRYIRGDTYGFVRIQSLMDRISVYPNISIACSFTISNYNIFHLDECARVLTDMGLLRVSDTLCNIVENMH